LRLLLIGRRTIAHLIPGWRSSLVLGLWGIRWFRAILLLLISRRLVGRCWSGRVNSNGWLGVRLLGRIGLLRRIRLLGRRICRLGSWFVRLLRSRVLRLRGRVLWLTVGWWRSILSLVFWCVQVCRRLESGNVDISRILILHSWFVGLDVCSKSGRVSGIFDSSVEAISVNVGVGAFSVTIRVLLLIPILLVSIPVVNFVTKLIWLRRVVVLLTVRWLVGWRLRIGRWRSLITRCRRRVG